jgi:hypothetical protein
MTCRHPIGGSLNEPTTPAMYADAETPSQMGAR